MNLSISGFVKQIRGYFKKLNKKKRIAVILAIFAVVSVAVILTVVLNKNSYTVLYRGLSPAEGAEVIEILEGLGADYKVDNAGTIYVLTKDQAMLKMQLASEGYPQSSLTYDIFLSASDLMTTDYEKKQYLIFQLQERLQDSIKTLNGVNKAIVTLSIADDSSFVLKQDKTESSASVVLDLAPSVELTKKQIKGIEELVSKSVSGLKSENVVIIDGDGNILNSSSEVDGIDGAFTQLELVNSINNLYKNKIISLLEPVFGRGGISVAVNVVVDFKKSSSEETTYSPVIGDSGIISHHDSEYSSVNGGRPPGGVVGVDPNTGTPSYQEDEEENTNTNSSTSSKSSTDYLVNKMIKTIIDNGGSIEDMTVAVMINAKNLPDGAVEQYRELVAYSAGIPAQKVAVTVAEFKGEEEPGIKPVEPQTPLYELLGLEKYVFYAIIGGAALLLIIILIVLILIIKHRRKKKKELEMKKKREQLEKEAVTKLNMPGEIVLNETREQALKKQIKEFSTGNPEIVAQLLRAWMREDISK
jgi:flagellar M-ring protein FliF